MKDNYDDELMKLAGELLAEKRSERFDRLNAAERAYSPRFRKRWERLLCRTRAGRNGRAVSGRNLLRVTAVTAAAVILMTAAAAVPVIPVMSRMISAMASLFLLAKAWQISTSCR